MKKRGIVKWGIIECLVHSIVDTDKFLDMPATTRALYFHLGMAADDFGFVGSPKKIMRSTNSSQSDLELLILKSYIIPLKAACALSQIGM